MAVGVVDDPMSTKRPLGRGGRDGGAARWKLDFPKGSSPFPARGQNRQDRGTKRVVEATRTKGQDKTRQDKAEEKGDVLSPLVTTCALARRGVSWVQLAAIASSTRPTRARPPALLLLVPYPPKTVFLFRELQATPNSNPRCQGLVELDQWHGKIQRAREDVQILF